MKWCALVACALVACGDDGAQPGPDAPQCSTAFTPRVDLLGRYVTELSVAPRYTLAEKGVARQYLQDQLTALGLVPQLHTYSTGVNVRARIPATQVTTKLVVVGAHYDTVSGSPGANDNATGVALVLEVARAIAAAPCRKHDVDVVFFDEEEEGLYGSLAYAKTLNPAEVVAVHTIDQVGWDADHDRGYELELPTPGLESEYRASASVAPPAHLATTSTQGTDHQSFRILGMPAVGLTEAYVGGDTSPYRHTPQDTAATVGTDYLALGTLLVAQVISLELR